MLESGGRRKAGELDGVSNKHRQMPGKVGTRVIGLAKEERKIRKGEERGEREGTEECFRAKGYCCGEQGDLSIQ